MGETMEVMEEGNLMDRVPILLARDLEFYQKHQRILQEPICLAVIGGKLDFPRYASFASIKLVYWWEDEYLAAYKKHSGLLHSQDEKLPLNVSVKNSDPEKFVSLVTKCADLLLEHLHTLSQESLDHADLSVLTATIGAAALIKNSLNIYLQTTTQNIILPKGDEKGGSIKMAYKQFSQMAESLAERLLDLHCRLLLIYILQDADSLYWEDSQPFFESERGSYTIQMWWHYMKGTQEDLWNSVPPKMAERIFAGMLNETLSVLTVRYSHIVTSPARAQLHVADVCNILFCVSELLPYICTSGEAYIGLQLTKQSVIIRDIHSKCKELFYSLILRAAPLGVLSKCFRKGVDNMDLFTSRDNLPSAWSVFTLPKYFPNDQGCQWVSQCTDLSTNTAIALELRVLLASPEAEWSHVVKILLMRDSTVATIIMHHLMKYLPPRENFKNVIDHPFARSKSYTKCKAFLCRSECFNAIDELVNEVDPVGQSNCQVVLSLTYILLIAGKSSDINTSLITGLDRNYIPNWVETLDKKQVWNQKRSPWLEAIAYAVYPITDCIVEVLLNSVDTGSSMYQCMALAITCIMEMFDCLPDGFFKVTHLLQDILPVSIRPLGDSVLFQIVFMALYTELIKTAQNFEKMKTNEENDENEAKCTTCYTLSEAICSIDEDDKHTEQINLFIQKGRERWLSQSSGGGRARSSVSTAKIEDVVAGNKAQTTSNGSPTTSFGTQLDVETVGCISEVMASDIMVSEVGRVALRVCYVYMKNNKEWLFRNLGVLGNEMMDTSSKYESAHGQEITETKTNILKSMFYIGSTPFDQLLTGSLKIDYLQWLQTPLSLNVDRCWLHLSRRFEFQENAKLSMADAAMVATITKSVKRFVTYNRNSSSEEEDEAEEE